MPFSAVFQFRTWRPFFFFLFGFRSGSLSVCDSWSHIRVIRLMCMWLRILARAPARTHAVIESRLVIRCPTILSLVSNSFPHACPGISSILTPCPSCSHCTCFLCLRSPSLSSFALLSRRHCCCYNRTLCSELVPSYRRRLLIPVGALLRPRSFRSEFAFQQTVASC